MKKIINGKKYDTDTAKCVGYYGNGLPINDFKWYAERLFKKKTGEFFLYGEGGPMTDYACGDGNGNYGYGDIITPLSESEAKEWAERCLDGDEYEEIFGEVEE